MDERPFNQLTPAQAERLDWLTEELGEVLQALGKVKRHGYDSDNRGLLQVRNRQALERELGDVLAAVHMMINAGDLDEHAIDARRIEKLGSVVEWLHHQPLEAGRCPECGARPDRPRPGCVACTVRISPTEIPEL